MNQEKVWQNFINLPPKARRQVMDFMVFLRTRYAPSHRRRTAKSTKLANEPFIGMWRSREDFQDSSAWVRRVRKNEWVKRSA
jgi:hypothetical protein